MTGGRAPGVIERVAWRSFGVPFARAFQTSRSSLAVREGLLVTLLTSDGHTGIGEASPLSQFDGGTLEATARAIELLGRQLLGRTLEDAWTASWPGADPGDGSPAVARAGLETAIADAASRVAGVQAWSWLAQREGVAMDSAPDIPVNAVIDSEQPADVADAVREAAAAGFRTVKLKVGGHSWDDLGRVAAAGEAGGERLALRIDANGAWDEAFAMAFLGQCERYGVALCEQPLDPRRGDVFTATARLRERVTVPIALDESIRTIGNLATALELQTSDAIVVKPMLTGLREAVAMLRAARAVTLPVIVTTTFDTAVGTAMALNLSALLPEPRPACGLATLDRLEHTLAATGPACRNGFMTPVPEPGLGVIVDEAALRRYVGAITGSVSR